MNELIEELFERYASERGNNISMLFTDFAQAIQTACKAQRNACIRRIRDEYLKNIRIDLISTVLTAEIEREDYE